MTPEYLFIQADSSRGDTENIELNKSKTGDVQVNLSEISTGIDIQPNPCLVPSDTCELWTIFAETWATPATYSIPVSYTGTEVSGSFGAHAVAQVTVYQPGAIAPATRLAAGAGGQSFMWSEGEVLAWGPNDKARLGLGYRSIAPSYETFNPLPLPTLNFPGFDIVDAVAVGGSHVMALLGDGTVWAWGDNTYGQLGDDTKADSIAPVQVTGLAGVQSIAAGKHHSMALLDNGSVWSWGDNTYGQLGHPEYEGGASSIPVQLYQFDSGITAISGRNRKCAGDPSQWKHDWKRELVLGQQ